MKLVASLWKASSASTTAYQPLVSKIYFMIFSFLSFFPDTFLLYTYSYFEKHHCRHLLQSQPLLINRCNLFCILVMVHRVLIQAHLERLLPSRYLAGLPQFSLFYIDHQANKFVCVCQKRRKSFSFFSWAYCTVYTALLQRSKTYL